MTVWKQITEFPQYEVSSDGQVRNAKTGRILTQTDVYFGNYNSVSLYSKEEKRLVVRRVHRLVARAFIPNPDNKPEIDHINKNKFDNRVENLRWATRSENMLNRSFSKPIVMTTKAEDAYEMLFSSTRQAAEQIAKEQNIESIAAIQVAISQVCNGKRKVAYGHCWHFFEDFKFGDKDYLPTK